MNNFIKYCYLTLNLLIASVSAEVRPEIEVVGKGYVEVVPDGFYLTLTVAERGKITQKVEALVDKKIAAVVNIANQLSLKTNDITIAGVNFRIIHETPSPDPKVIKVKQPRQASVYFDGQILNQQTSSSKIYQQPLFEVSRQITLQFSNAKQYGQFLTQIVKISVHSISPPFVNVSKQGDFYQQALLKAINNAKEKASFLAKNLGVELGKLAYIKELTQNQDCPLYFDTEINENHLCDHISSADDLVIKAKVLLKFALKE